MGSLRLCSPLAEAILMAITRNILTCRLNLLRSSPSISLLDFHRNLSTLGDANIAHDNHSTNAHTHYPNPFTEFVTTKFNLSSADVARMFKFNPSLERLKTLEKLEQIVELLKTYGCTQQQIASIMKQLPACLSMCPEKVIMPKIVLLRDLGIQGEDLVKVVGRNPRVLAASLQHTLLPNAAFLQNVFKMRDLFIKAILRQPSILTYDLERHLKPSVAFFEECGLVGEEFSKFILLRPGLLLCSCLTPAKAEFLQKIRVEKGSKMYKHVLMMVVGSRPETLEAKMDNFQQCGLTVEETLKLFRVFPFAFCFSIERVRQNMDFVVNDMDLPASSVLKKLHLLRYSLKVLKPRFLVLKRIQTLKNLGHLGIRGLASILAMSEVEFVNKIIEGHPESRLLKEIYQEALTDALAKTKAGTKKENIRQPWCF